MYKSNYEVEILVNGHPVKEYWKDGKTFIEGRKGAEFSLKIRNNGYKRILAIPTIDGLSVLNGKEANYNSPGYIIDGYNSVTIDGWRVSDKEVAKFYFTDPGDSYSQRTDKKDNLGVIGIAIFREKERIYPTYTYPPYPYEWPRPWWRRYPWEWFDDNRYPCSSGSGTYTLDSADGGMNLSASTTLNAMNTSQQFSSGTNFPQETLSQDIGTGFGEYKESRVVGIEFDKESNPDAVFTIFYNTREQLEKIGIDFSERPKYVTPQAFPNGFCEPPK